MINLNKVISIKHNNKNVNKIEDATGIMWEYQVNRKGLNFTSWPVNCINNELINNYSRFNPGREDIWYDGTNVRYDDSSKSYKWTLDNGWVEVGTSVGYGRYIWTDGTNIYYNELNVSKIYNKSTDSWSNYSWTKGAGAEYEFIDGRYVWTDGTDFYCHFYYGIQAYYTCCKIDINTRTINRNSNITTLLKVGNTWCSGDSVFKYNDDYYLGRSGIDGVYKIVNVDGITYPVLIKVETGPLATYTNDSSRLAVINNNLYYIDLYVDYLPNRHNCKVYSTEYEEWIPVVFTAAGNLSGGNNYIYASNCIDYNIGYLALNKVCKPRGVKNNG